jgi:hypothetical protein
MSRTLSPSLLAALALMTTLGCQRDEVSRSREVPAPQSAAPMAMPPAGGGMAGDVPMPPAPAAALKWTLPKGWVEEKGSGMRFATLKPSIPGKIDVSVVVLPGAAGGELSNVNRWRGQIGLAPIDEKALGTARQTLKSKAGTIALFDFTSEGQAKTRMVTGILSTPDGSSWFLKMVGDADPVAKAKPDFTRFMESLRLDSAN